MKSLAKVLGLVVLAIVLLLAALLFFLTQMFDPNDYREQIQQAARDQARVELTLGGEIGWSLFPWLGIELSEVSVAPLDDPDQPLAQIGNLGLGVEVMPLLRRQLRMSDVILDSVQINLLVDEQGRGNWQSFTEDGAADAEPAEGSQPEQEGGDFNIAVESVRITNAGIDYRDQQSGQRLSIRDANLTSGALIPGEPIDLDLEGLLVLEDPALRMRLGLDTVLTFDPGRERYQLQGLDLQVTASGEPFSGRSVDMRLQGDALYDGVANVAEVEQMRLALNDLRASGEFRASNLAEAVRLGGRIDVAEFDGRALLGSLGQDVPETANADALKRIALAANLNGSASSLLLEDLRLQLDGTELRGNLGVSDFSRQALRFDLRAAELNLDDYLPPTAESTAPDTSAGRGGSRSDQPPEPWSDEPVLPLDLLASLDVDGRLALDQVQLTGQSINAFKAAVVARNGRVQITALEGDMFEGSFDLTAEIDSRQTPLSISLNANLEGMNALALQRGYQIPEQLRGQLNTRTELRAQGNSIKRWMNSLGGNARFDVAEGALLGINMEEQLCSAIALVNRESLSEPFAAEDTVFEQLSGSFTIRDGVISNSDMRAALPGMEARGRGDINLPDQRLDYRVGLVLEGDTREMPDPACRVNERYQGIEWPLRCRGYLHNAASSCGVDSEGVGQIAARLLGREAQRKLEERLFGSRDDDAEDDSETETEVDAEGEGDEEREPDVRDAIRGLLNR
ncbi:AsmA family protein [Halopseudomonas salegens]|uniref:AsmA protein n=1 Tax=Halopseudomonas salegens TaxID=1434072 RepID=A0A1H2E417_9GAMM|nr:AsmA family protein [Halopseudomonas salegens]SDT89749.1 AsmA protein [Halopseudomonas salegens]